MNCLLFHHNLNIFKIMDSLNSFSYKNPYYFVMEARKLLNDHGYVEFNEEVEWENIPNKFYVVRNDSSLVIVNKHDTSSALIVATHNDSPCLKLKPNTKLSRFGFDQVRAAPYGNVAYSTWYDRGLTYIGKILTKTIPTPNSTDSKIVSTVVAAAGSAVAIPSLAKHLGGLQITINPELHTVPIDSLKVPTSDNQSGQLIRDILSLSGISEKLKKLDQEWKKSPEYQADIEKNAKTETEKSNKKSDKSCSYVNDVLHIQPKDLIVDWDLSLIPSEPTRYIGTGGDMVAGYGIDVLASAIHSMKSFVEANDPEEGMNVLAIFDNFQINSNTRIGAKSTLLTSVFERIGCDSLTWANSRLLTIDNFYAYNPNEPTRFYNSDSVNAGDGLFIHSEMGRCGSANLNFKSQLLYLAKKKKIPLTPSNLPQYFSSSIAQDMETQINIETAIVGIPIIGLKTSRELAFNDDILCIQKLVSDYYNHFRSIPAIHDI